MRTLQVFLFVSRSKKVIAWRVWVNLPYLMLRILQFDYCTCAHRNVETIYHVALNTSIHPSVLYLFRVIWGWSLSQLTLFKTWGELWIGLHLGQSLGNDYPITHFKLMLMPTVRLVYFFAVVFQPLTDQMFVCFPRVQLICRCPFCISPNLVKGWGGGRETGLFLTSMFLRMTEDPTPSEYLK